MTNHLTSRPQLTIAPSIDYHMKALSCLGRSNHMNPLFSALRRFVPPALFGLCLGASTQALALEYGPFFLNGFAKAELMRGSNHCIDCQRFPNENKQRLWADELVPGTPYGTRNTTLTLFQPYLGARFDVGGGFKVEALISQRWRDGRVDIPGFWYHRNVALIHEEYGSFRIGAMPARAWSIADYPYGTNLGLADPWASSGAGYGLNTRAIRYTSRMFDVADGDLVFEATYDTGDNDFKIHKPWLLEIFAQYHKGDLVIDAMYQDSRNGNPQAWGHGPFTGPTPFPVDDTKLGGSGQSIFMVMARYQLNSAVELDGGIRRNRWSGAYAVITQPGPPAIWNNMFNVNWGGSLNGVPNPGFAATSVDLLGGIRYRIGQWTASVGTVYLGKADTNNPSERGQSNTALFNTFRLNFDFGNGFSAYTTVGFVHYGRLGLSPMSMPTNSAFTNVDSRVTRNGNGAGFGVVYVF